VADLGIAALGGGGGTENFKGRHKFQEGVNFVKFTHLVKYYCNSSNTSNRINNLNNELHMFITKTRIAMAVIHVRLAV